MSDIEFESFLDELLGSRKWYKQESPIKSGTEIKYLILALQVHEKENSHFCHNLLHLFQFCYCCCLSLTPLGRVFERYYLLLQLVVNL
jgi:hypothetical protein